MCCLVYGRVLDIRVKPTLESISSTFYSRIFRTKVHSKQNSEERKAAQSAFVQKMCLKMLMKLTPAEMHRMVDLNGKL